MCSSSDVQHVGTMGCDVKNVRSNAYIHDMEWNVGHEEGTKLCIYIKDRSKNTFMYMNVSC